MKAACLVLTLLIAMAIMAICVMVKYATDITVEEKKREYNHGGEVYRLGRSMGIISLSEKNNSMAIAQRFPYVAAIIKNSSKSWSFACFGSIILVKWVVTAAHCRKEGSTHRVLLYYDFSRNYTHTYPVMYWRLHEKFNISNPSLKYDIAVAKLNVDNYPFSMKPSVIDDKEVLRAEASVWKTVSTMDKKMYLTNDFDIFEARITYYGRCFEAYGVQTDESLICADFSKYENECIVHEFGPLYRADKVVGLLTVKPRDCDLKVAVFTNVSYYANWILKSTHTTYYG